MFATVPRLLDASSVSSILAAPIAVACGFPSPAQDYYDGPIDLDELLVDRSKRAQHGDIIVAVLDGELTVKRLEVTGAGVVLKSENSEHPDIVVAELSDLQVWGVATYCIHHLR